MALRDHWQSLNAGKIKLTVIVEWLPRFCGVGAIFRDHQGVIYSASTMSIYHVTSALQAEAIDII